MAAMNANIACLIFSCLALANAGLIPTAKYLEGPSTRTKLIGPDGSIIDAYAPGGKILLEEGADSPLIQTSPVVYAYPAIAEHPTLQLQEVASASSPAELISRVSEDGSRLLLHPGTAPRVESREFVPITEETKETAVEVSTTTEYPGGVSGTYVPDSFEKLYDDGSYRVEHY